MLTEPLREKTNRQTRSNTNQAVQLQKQGRGLELWISVEEELYYPSSENRGADQLSSNCAFCLAYEIVSFLMQRLNSALGSLYERTETFQKAK